MGEYVQLPRRKLHWYYSIADFANIFKAFIGTNYLSLAYGFKQSGLGFGVAGLLLVAVLTGHCCRLIVKCKHIVIDDLCRKYELSKEEDNDADLSDMAMFRIRLLRRLDYTDIGRLICGRWGGFVVNFCLVITQVGFCVGYFIFIGNTIHGLFPKTWVSVAADGTYSLVDQPFTHITTTLSQHHSAALAAVNANRHFRTAENILEHHNSNILSPNRFIRQLNSSLGSQLSSSEDGLFDKLTEYYENVNETSTITKIKLTSGHNSTGIDHIKTMHIEYENSTAGSSLVNISSAVSTTKISSDSPMDMTAIKTNTASSSMPTIIEDFILESLGTTVSPSNSGTMQQPQVMNLTSEDTTGLSNVTNVPKEETLWRVSSAPSLVLLVLSPLPLLILFTFFRTVRQMALISVGANIAILIGLFSVLFYILADFRPSSTIVWYRWLTLPVFFGQLTGAYEAIGIIIPIESSMEGNQHMFPGCLSGAISIFTGLLGALAVVGYTQFGEDTDQIIAQNLATDNMVGLLINITLIFGVVCTYPLQVFPVVEIMEGLLFSDGKVCGPKMMEQSDEFDLSDNEEDPEKALLSTEAPQFHLPVASFVSKSVPAWKRNLLRSAIAIVIALIAVSLRRVFAYVGALVGAIGSSPLVFIMPCLFHFKLRRHEVSPLILAKDVAIIVFGAIAGSLSFIVVVQEIIDRA